MSLNKFKMSRLLDKQEATVPEKTEEPKVEKKARKSKKKS
jgi:hypothetical protein